MSRDWSLRQVTVAFLCIYVVTLGVAAVVVGIVVNSAHRAGTTADHRSCLRSNDVRLARNHEARAIGIFVASDAHLRRAEAGATGGLSALDVDTAITWAKLVPQIASPERMLPECLTVQVARREAADQRWYDGSLAHYRDTLNLTQP